MPADWATPGGIRDQVLGAPGGRVCKLRLDDGCTRYATEVDHIVAGDDHSMSNLQSACEHCHRIKSSREGNAVPRVRERRPAEVHPAYRSMGSR